MRDQLVGYLLDALEPSEQELVEQQLAADPKLRRELELLHRSLDPLRADRGAFDPPRGLCERTCRYVVERMTTLSRPEVKASRWTFSDVTIMAGIMLIASSLFFPALQHSRQAARLAACQNNLRQIGTSLDSYSQRHRGYFPEILPGSNFGAAGVYAVRLAEEGSLPDPRLVVCPASQLAEQREFHLPSTIELRSAKGETLVTFHRTMGGSYGYTLGYVSGDQYQPTKNRHRSNFALVADAPLLTSEGLRSVNHGLGGQNVLFEDGHVGYLTQCQISGCGDNIYLNDQEQPAAGLHENDAVVAGSSARPLITPVKLQK
jgi:hypothetical protein